MLRRYAYSEFHSLDGRKWRVPIVAKLPAHAFPPALQQLASTIHQAFVVQTQHGRAVLTDPESFYVHGCEGFARMLLMLSHEQSELETLPMSKQLAVVVAMTAFGIVGGPHEVWNG